MVMVLGLWGLLAASASATTVGTTQAVQGTTQDAPASLAGTATTMRPPPHRPDFNCAVSAGIHGVTDPDVPTLWNFSYTGGWSCGGAVYMSGQSDLESAATGTVSVAAPFTNVYDFSHFSSGTAVFQPPGVYVAEFLGSAIAPAGKVWKNFPTDLCTGNGTTVVHCVLSVPVAAV